jgi:hypothetical protein
VIDWQPVIIRPQASPHEFGILMGTTEPVKPTEGMPKSENIRGVSDIHPCRVANLPLPVHEGFLRKVARRSTRQPPKVVEHIGSFIKAGDWRLSLVNSSFKDFVPILPDLVSRMEEEEHRGRVLAVGRP